MVVVLLILSAASGVSGDPVSRGDYCCASTASTRGVAVPSNSYTRAGGLG